jgi:hypothetical protein
VGLCFQGFGDLKWVFGGVYPSLIVTMHDGVRYRKRGDDSAEIG